MRPAWPAAALVASLLLLVYSATLALDVTLWDAGELIAAVHTVGIPHPPGTPLFVLAGRAWTLLLDPLPVALAANLMSAVATATACGLLALLLGEWTGSRLAAVSGGIAGGAMSSVWRNATETEVYALALLLGAAMLVAGDRAGRTDDCAGGAAPPSEGAAARRWRWTVLLAYLMALAVPLHLFSLVAAPAAVLLAATSADRRTDWLRGGSLALVALLAFGVGTMRSGLLLVTAALAVAGAVLLLRPRAPGGEPGWRRLAGPAATLTVALLALSALAVLVVRARHDPLVNQGNPAGLSALADVVARRQYAVAPLWPRRAPVWLQVGNLFEYADWQVALSLAPGPAPGWGRTGATLVFGLLAALGSAEHRRRDRRSWRALLVLLTGASLGVVAYLNLAAGPSFGADLLPPSAPHEARERDYFFVFAFWSWGAWAGVGAAVVARSIVARLRVADGRRQAAAVPLALSLAALPVVLNWRAVDRQRGADATLALDAGRALLESAPAGAVLLTAGDLDSYPLWYLQVVHDRRPDVTVVVVPMLPAAWYRAELARRWSLLAVEPRWRGQEPTLAGIGAAARREGRPLLATALVSAAARRAAAPRWSWGGSVLIAVDEMSRADPVAARRVDRGLAVNTAALAAAQIVAWREDPPSDDPAARLTRRLLACAAAAVTAADSAPVTELAGRAGARLRPAEAVPGGPAPTPETPDRRPDRLLASWCNPP